MARKHIDENLEEDIHIPVSTIDAPDSGAKKGKEIIYKKDRTGWLVLPFALLLFLFCIFSAFLSFSEDPSGGVAGQTVDMVLATLGTFRTTSDDNGSQDTTEAPTATKGAVVSDSAVVSGGVVASDGAVVPGDAIKPGVAVVSDDAVKPGVAVASGGAAKPGGAVASDDAAKTGGDLYVNAISKNIASSITIDKNFNFYTQTELIPNRSDSRIDIETVTRSSIGSGVSLKSMMKGSWEGNVYRNQFAEFTLTLDNNWERKNESESYIISTEDVVGALVSNNESGDNILIRFFNMAVTSGGQEVYEEDFLEGMRRMGEQDQNLNAIFGDVFQVNVGTKQYKGIKESVEGVINLYYLARRIGDYMSIISIKSDEELETILKMFK